MLQCVQAMASKYELVEVLLSCVCGSPLGAPLPQIQPDGSLRLKCSLNRRCLDSECGDAACGEHGEKVPQDSLADTKQLLWQVSGICKDLFRLYLGHYEFTLLVTKNPKPYAIESEGQHSCAAAQSFLIHLKTWYDVKGRTLICAPCLESLRDEKSCAVSAKRSIYYLIYFNTCTSRGKVQRFRVQVQDNTVHCCTVLPFPGYQ